MFQLFANPPTISDNCSGKKRKALGGHFSGKLQNKAVQSVAAKIFVDWTLSSSLELKCDNFGYNHAS